MKKLIFISIILLSTFSIIYLKWERTKPDIVNEKISEIVYSYELLIPVTKFTSLKRNISSNELYETTFYTTAENKDLVPDYVNLEITVDPELQINEEKIALLKPSQIKPWYKSLIVSGQNPWDKTLDINQYPFSKIDLQFIELGSDFVKPKNSFQVDEITRIFAGGEIIPSRAVDRLGLNKHDNYTYLFDNVSPYINSADISMALLENSLLGNPTPCTGCMLFQGDEKVAKGLADVGFDVLSTAGNHAGDAGQEAYENTLKILHENNIQTTGTSNSTYDLLNPVIKELNGEKLGFIGADDVAYYYWKLSEDSGNYGTNYFSKRDENGVLSIDYDRVEKVSNIKSEFDLDKLIVFMSWGVEYTNNATEHQKELGHLLIDEGVDIIIASHPHWVQNIEFYKGKPIIYSLGNLIFDQTHTTPTRQGLVSNLYFYKNELKSIELIPIQTCGYHQTSTDLAERYLKNEISLDEANGMDEKNGCIYWQPRIMDEETEPYKEILERVYENTTF